MTIEPQKDGESLEARVDEAKLTEEIIDSLPTPEEEDVEMDEDNPNMVPEPPTSEMDSEDVREGTVEETEPLTAPVGPADYETSTHIAPQVLEEAHTFLNRYGINTSDLTPKEVMAKIEKIHVAKAENAQVLSRGQATDTIDRLLSYVPNGFVGEFKGENDMDVARAEALGFTVFLSEEAKLESSTGTADGRVRCADQILMIIPEERYIANRLIKAERLAERRKAHDYKGGAQIDQSGSDPLFPLIKL